MITIQLPEGETIKIIGQNTTHLIVVNKNGDIYTRTDANRDDDVILNRKLHSQNLETIPVKETKPLFDNHSDTKNPYGHKDLIDKDYEVKDGR